MLLTITVLKGCVINLNNFLLSPNPIGLNIAKNVVDIFSNLTTFQRFFKHSFAFPQGQIKIKKHDVDITRFSINILFFKFVVFLHVVQRINEEIF